MSGAAHRAGFAALLGPPNAGKSTLLNRVLGEKLAIVSHRPQTTRSRILGIVSREDAQILFLDTPGIHDARGLLNRRMVDEAVAALEEVELVLLLGGHLILRCQSKAGTQILIQ